MLTIDYFIKYSNCVISVVLMSQNYYQLLFLSLFPLKLKLVKELPWQAVILLQTPTCSLQHALALVSTVTETTGETQQRT